MNRKEVLNTMPGSQKIYQFNIKATAFILVLFNSLFLTGEVSFAQKKPNVIVVLTDDMGYGDLACYGNPLFSTPFIDNMARNGVLATNFVTTSPTCSPSRVSTLTGRYCSRSKMPRVIGPGDKTAIPDEEVTIAEMLKTSAYRTACIGKWHIGDYGTGLANKQGFDLFYGMLYSHDFRAPYVKTDTVMKIFRNQKPEIYRPNDTILTKTYTEEAIKFVKESGKKKQPFFLYLAYNMPHLPVATAVRKGNKKSAGGELGSVIEEMDTEMAKLWKTLVDNGEADHTIFIFTSDNGPWLNAPQRMYDDGVTRPYHVGTAGIFRGSKATSYEGGHRVPFIVYYKNHTASQVIKTPISNLDILPTIAEWTNTALPKRILDGESVVSLLSKKGNQQVHKPIYYFNYVLEGVKDGDWKLRVTKQNDKTVNELFNLSWDPTERYNLYNEPKYASEQQHLQQLLNEYPDK
jgi:arylsulfatase A